MHSESLAGNRDGTGTALEFDHFFAIGAKIAPDMSVKITQPVAQFIDESPEEVKKQWAPGDPYLTLSHGKILHSDPLRHESRRLPSLLHPSFSRHPRQPEQGHHT